MPPYLFNNTPSLRYINMGTNSLSGPIPHGVASLPMLDTLILNKNQLFGTIPPGIYKNQLDNTRQSRGLCRVPFRLALGKALVTNSLTGPLNLFCREHFGTRQRFCRVPEKRHSVKPSSPSQLSRVKFAECRTRQSLCRVQ